MNTITHIAIIAVIVLTATGVGVMLILFRAYMLGDGKSKPAIVCDACEQPLDTECVPEHTDILRLCPHCMEKWRSMRDRKSK